ncbi:putative myb DNA-binding [Lyophyllum shimeji]|uniref:Myb DNA-binding n=1 Tax=Lyophyllum shimeji TaxID=47721 RepID=A0A9P3UT74_LYOSH|nr:putative myb DNA-binding [Lyophyllum shimeji]
MSPGSLDGTGASDNNTLQVPSASTFSFKAPFPASSSSFAAASPLKQRRVSLALPSSPRVVQAWNFRDDTGLDSHVPETETSGLVPEKRGKMRKLATRMDGEPFPEKKQRKKWSDEETQMLVSGCNRHGVGNWKTILSDPTLKFDNRSPVDLKDRFRTYFPDAYKEHYPNARTHLSSKVRSTLPDGSSLFEKTRSKKRRPFTEEEDRALKAGYEKHGTVWATIVKDPIFREQGRRSTDLRDRFRNAFPELYQAAGYKPRNASKKKQAADGPPVPVRAATDDQLAMSTTGPVRRRQRSHTSQGLLRGGTKSVPQSTACSEDDDSSAGEEDSPSMFKTPHTPVFVDNVSTSSSRSKKFLPFSTPTDDDEMEMVTFDQFSDTLAIPDFMPTSSSDPQYPEMDGQSQNWSSGINTPTHSTHAWSTAAGSPTSSHLSADYLMSASHSPALQRRNDPFGGMIGKSAWGTQDWFSANPRLDPGSSSAGSGEHPSSPPYPGDAFSPASPFSHHNLNHNNLANHGSSGSHGVLDRYDLLPTLLPHDFSSEVGVGDSHSTFSDEMMFPPSGFRGFTHHSNYAGDLIFGARTHQPQHQSFAGGAYGAGFGFGTAAQGLGLGLSGMPQSAGIHPMQLALPGIDEIELTGITLDDSVGHNGNANGNAHGADTGMAHDSNGLENEMDRNHQHQHQQQNQQQKPESRDALSTTDRFSLDDLVDLSAHDHDHDHDLELHATPPSTPLLSSHSQARSTRRSSGSTSLQGYHAAHGRSISVPPSEARAGAGVSSPVRPLQAHASSQPDMGLCAPSSSSSSRQHYFPPGTSKEVQGNAAAPSAAPQSQSQPQSQSRAQNQGTVRGYPAQMLVPSLSHDAYGWRPMVLGEAGTNTNANTNTNAVGNNNGLSLSFLDLHYYGNGNAGVVGEGPAGDERQGQALDLASSVAVASTSAQASALKSMGIPASLRQHIPGVGQGPGAGAGGSLNSGNGHAVRAFEAGKVMTGGGAAVNGGATRSQSHHRGQSAVCPQDLVLRSDNNKRKRASWDGAHS